MTDGGIEFDCDWVKRGKKAVVRVSVAGQIKHSDTCDPSSARSRNAFKKGLIAKIPVLKGSDGGDKIEDYLVGLSAEGRGKAGGDRQPESLIEKQDRLSAELLEAMPQQAKDDAERMLRNPQLIEEIFGDIESMGVVGERELALSVYMVGVSRLLDSPVSAIVQGSSSSGKSHVVDTIARLFPDDDALLKATDMTKNALYYIAPGDLMHRFVVGGERSRKEDDDRAEATRSLREMISSKVLRKMIPEQNAEGKQVTHVICNPGPIAFCETTTLSEIFEEDKNRCLLLASDDSSEQTKRIIDAAAQSHEKGTSVDRARIIEKHHAVQRMLRRVEVSVPFATVLAAAVPTERTEARRAWSQIIGVISAIALIHQFQRGDVEPTHGDKIQATGVDYGFARFLLLDPVGRSLGGGLPDHVKAYGDWLLSHYNSENGRAFKVPDLKKIEGCRWTPTRIYAHMTTLKDEGVVEQIEGPGRAKTWRVVSDLPKAGSEWMPDPWDLGIDIPASALSRGNVGK